MTDLERLRAEKTRRSLRGYIREAWPVLEPDTTYRHNWHIDAISDHLEAVSSGQIRNLVINVPPGCMKSLSTCVFWPTWSWIKNPGLRWMFASYASHLSTRDSIKCRTLIQSSWYQARYGDRYTLNKWTEDQLLNDRQGFRMATSTGGVGTGERVHIVVHDDLMRANDAHSEAILKQAIKHMEAMSTRGVNPATFAQVMIMQRLSEKDPAAWAIERGWTHLMLPMEFEPARKCTTSIGFEDPRTEEGQLLWPEHFPYEVVRTIEKDLNTYGAAAQLQQRPAPLGGGIIKSRHFGRYNVLPPLKYRKVYVDTAQKTAERNDYSVFQCWGLGEDGKIYITDQDRGKWEAPDLKQHALDFWAKHQPATNTTGKLRRMDVEDKASGTGLIQDIKRAGRIPIHAVERNKDKLTRVMDVVSYIEAGYVMLPQDAPWVADFIRECEAFTADDTHAHDDQIDPMVDAIDDLLGHRTPRKFFDPRK